MKKLPAYDPAKIEKKWQKKWASSKLYKSGDADAKPKFYVLDMFPYPSGEGLHVGHPKGYIATDIVSRMKRMQGMNVLHPMGFDAFGLPAENYAIKMKTNPMVAVAKNVERFKRQLELIGLDYDWSREINTTDPEYYKWTQWIFLQLFKKGLAYESSEPINWCPSCKTGLANEDVEDGRCERCSTPVEKKPMRQWVLKITDYADRLLQDLDAEEIRSFETTTGPDAFRPDQPVKERNVINAIVKHWSEDKYIGLKWKKADWQTVITGGIEPGQSPADAAVMEIIEETGYKHPVFKKDLGVMDSRFFHVPKNENRHAHMHVLYLELADGDREELTDEEKAKHDVVWVPKDKMIDFISPESQKYAWNKFLSGEKVSQPLLNWPESIKEAQRNWIGRSEGAEIDFRLVLSNKKLRFVILHGYKGTAKMNFLPWLKAELEKQGHQVEMPQLPNSINPKESEQVEYVINHCKLDENTVVIGHSLGAIVAMKALMRLNKPISGLTLVAAALPPGFNKESVPRIYHNDFDWDIDCKLVNKLSQGRIAVLSDTKEDHRMPWLQHLAKELSAALIETRSNEEHFCALEEPAVLDSVTPKMKVFTTRPDTLFGVTYMVLAPEHPWVLELLPHVENKKEVEQYIAEAKIATAIERTDLSKEKTGVELKGVGAINPANGEKVPVWIADYVLADYGTGAVMAVPAHDERDFAFAMKFGLPVRQVIAPYFENTTDLIPRKEKPTVRRRIVHAIVKHPSENKYLLLKLNKFSGNSLVTGGIDDGEDLIAAARREVIEETGYKNLKHIETSGSATEVHSYFYAAHKNENRYMIARGVMFQLVDEERVEVSADEKAAHEPFWVSAADARATITRVNQQLIWDQCFGYQSYIGDGRLINSAAFDDKDSGLVRKDITLAVSGRWVTRYKLRDWVFSRQRYWGEPIPLIHCEKCGVVAVSEKDLPVQLPKVKYYEPTGTGESPLAAINKWVNVKCPQCGGKGKRETNTMPQWAGSSWYYLRYEDPKNKKKLVDPAKEKYWSPVDLYVGGAEHATRHLIYARFWHKFLYDIGAVSSIEPFLKLQSVGLIMGEDGKKMSKRFGNVINPDDIIATYGADTLRLYEMFMGPFDQQIAWSTGSMIGSRRFIERVWKLAERATGTSVPEAIVHKTIKKVSEDIQALKFNTAISTLMICLNELEKSESVSRTSFETYLKLLAPFAPHIAEELWVSLGNKGSIHTSLWPAWDPNMLIDAEVKIMLQIDGKVRGSFMAPTGTGKEELEKIARDLPEARKWLENKQIKRIVVVPDKLVNIVAT